LGKTFCPNLYLAQSVYATGQWADSMVGVPRPAQCEAIVPV